MAIWDDFDLDFANRTIRHDGVGVTVYTSNALYSWLMDEFDAQAQMDDTVPISAQTPSEYTLINGWFMDDASTQHLRGGAIKSDGWTHPANTTGIRLLTFVSAGYISAIPTDITKPVVDGVTGDSGVLLDYNNTTREWWIRCDAVGDIFAGADAITITGGTGAGTTAGASASGDEIWSNVYTLGSIEAGTTIYLLQNDANITAWWAAGHIDVLVRVKKAGTLIDSGWLTALNRTYTDTYDYYEADVSTGGRNPLPLATADDLNNQTAVATVANYNNIKVTFVNGILTYDNGAGAGQTVNKVLWDHTSNATAFCLDTDAVAAGTLTLGNVEGVFGNNNAITQLEELKFKTQTGLFTVGDTVTGTITGHNAVIRRIVQDPQAVGTVGTLYVSGATGIFQDNEALTDTGTGAANADGTLTAAPTWNALVDGALASAHTMQKDLNNGDGLQPYDVIIECASRPIADVYEYLKFITRRTSTNTMYTVVAGNIVEVDGEQYLIAYTGYTAVKACPFGSFAGGKFFGARGIYVEGMDADDIKNFQLIDSDGDAQSPPNYVDVTVNGVVALDRVAVFLLTGAGGTINKDMCGGVEITPIGSDFLNVTGPIPGDLPASGVIRVVDDTDSSEQFYAYSAIDVPGLQFTGLVPVTDRAYNASDRCYIPYIDEAAGGTSSTVTIIQSVVRNVIVRVRKKGIVPFEVESTITATGMAVTAIRTADTIVT